MQSLIDSLFSGYEDDKKNHDHLSTIVNYDESKIKIKPYEYEIPEFGGGCVSYSEEHI
ncbi:hypothetical protein M0R19_07915 [Candidatus Pacearchaeota archaeon]|jgi:hypothetical protein|nr:hypothetical protein [bacterium]MCK9597083.1 hypothetical protein [Candidatus Pacearchaeota archaeon]